MVRFKYDGYNFSGFCPQESFSLKKKLMYAIITHIKENTILLRNSEIATGIEKNLVCLNRYAYIINKVW